MQVEEASLSDLEAALADRLADRMAPKSIRPLNDRLVLLELEEPATKKQGELYTVKQRQDRHVIYFVVAVSDKVKAQIEPGEYVYAGKHSGHNVDVAGVEFCMMKEHDLLGKIDPEVVES